MKIRTTLAASLAVLSIALFGLAFAGETNIVVKTVLVKMLCNCGGEMKATGQCYYTSYPPQYPHVCNKCGTNATYSVSYPVIRYVYQ